MGKIIILGSLILALVSTQSFAATIKFSPIEHASFIIETDQITMYVDPVGDLAEYNKYPKPDFILITHTHQDHLAPKLVKSLKQENTIIIGSEAAIKELGQGEVMKNGERKEFDKVGIEAIPMYNTTKDRLNFHPKGIGNGYVLTINGKRIYISGDTEDTPEMRSLKDIEHAFMCINLPYTMTPDQAASAVLEFKPRFVYPYHYRGQGGMSDIKKFKKLVSKDKNIKVQFLKWYK